MDKQLADCQRVIGYHFANPRLLETALTHSSLRTDDKECNERLEFLGDAVLGLVISEELYNQLPTVDEGELTRHKSQVVARGALYRTSQELGLARFADVARGVKQRGSLPVSIIANLVESVIGAIYLDSGFFPAREFIMRHMGGEMEETLAERGAKNHKSLLQHEVQQRVGSPPSYRTIDEGGPQHLKRFTVAALVRGREWGRASGQTKKEAEQAAARKALEAWKHRGSRRRRGARDAEPAAREAVLSPWPDTPSERAQAVGPKPPREMARPEREAPAEVKDASQESDGAARAKEPRRRRRRAASRDRGAEAEPVEVVPEAGGTSEEAPSRSRRRRKRGDEPPTGERPKIPAVAAKPEHRPATPSPTKAAADESEVPDAFADGIDVPSSRPARRRGTRRGEHKPDEAPAPDRHAAPARERAPSAASPDVREVADPDFGDGLGLPASAEAPVPEVAPRPGARGDEAADGVVRQAKARKAVRRTTSATPPDAEPEEDDFGSGL